LTPLAGPLASPKAFSRNLITKNKLPWHVS
jgi:hypothetical protein